MITLRELSRSDQAVASITSDECLFMSKVLSFVAALERRWFFKYLIPKEIRDHALKMRMLSAVLGRTQKEKQSLYNQIAKDIKAGRR